MINASTQCSRTHILRRSSTTTAKEPLCTLDLTSTMTSAQAPAAKGAAVVTKKLLLWLVLLLQICFIACFWLLQLDFNASASSSTIGNGGGGGAMTTGVKTGVHLEGVYPIDSPSAEITKTTAAKASLRVNFIKEAAVSGIAEKRLKKKQQTHAQTFKIHVNMLSNFAKDFFLKPKKRLNRTELENEVPVDRDAVVEKEQDFEWFTQQPLWCFREGSINETSDMETVEDYLLLGADYEQCKCKPGWHGSDCGQPEIIWRAFMRQQQPQSAKRPFTQWDPSQHEVNRLVYMLEGNFLSLDLLELQIKTIGNVVDIFIIYVRKVKASLKEIKSLQHRLKEVLSRGNYFVFHCSAAWKENCTTARVYAQFKRQLQQTRTLELKPTDLFLYSKDDALISPLALHFLKYYAAEMQMMRFRLKYIVYGFFWQHPAQTRLTGVISSFRQLDDPRLGNADPAQLLRQAHSPDSDALIIGDLNHFGGWHCKYCLQPEEIITELQLHAEYSSSPHQVYFPNATRSRHIDVAYMHKLIANGLYVDGKTQLMRLRHHADKYYAPPNAQENSWKFGHLLVNLYESLDDAANEEEAEGIY